MSGTWEFWGTTVCNLLLFCFPSKWPWGSNSYCLPSVCSFLPIAVCLCLWHKFSLYDDSAGELSAAELENLMVIVGNPRQFKIPDWFLNRKKDHKDGRYSQVVSNALDMKLRDDLERLKKIRYGAYHLL